MRKEASLFPARKTRKRLVYAQWRQFCLLRVEQDKPIIHEPVDL